MELLASKWPFSCKGTLLLGIFSVVLLLSGSELEKSHTEALGIKCPTI